MSSLAQNPLCAVWVVTYNQKNFISQTIEGILCQQTAFPVKIYIGDDQSNDGTTEICEQFSRRFPEKIELIKNHVHFMQQNSENIYTACLNSGAKYIAMCEGDDFWTDPLKLQKQVQFLEANDDFSICFHNASVFYEENLQPAKLSNSGSQKEITGFEDLAQGEYIYTPTVVFRSRDFLKFPKHYYKYINNYTLDLHNSQYGKIKYINEVMCTYRVHKGGIWSMVAREKILVDQLPTYKFYLNYFDKRYRKYFLNHLSKMTAELVSIQLSNKDGKNFWRYFKDYATYNYRNKYEFTRFFSFFIKGCYRSLKGLFSSFQLALWAF